MNIHVYGTEGSMILTFHEKTVTSTIKDVAGRTVQQRTLLPLSVPAHKKVVSDISIRMNLITISGEVHCMEQTIRWEVDLQSQKEAELHRYRCMFQNVQQTVNDIRKVTDLW